MKEAEYQKLVETLSNSISGLQAVYVFGSSAAEARHKGSDIDLAFLSSSPVTQVQCWEIAQKLAVKVKTDVDLVDLRSASTVMRMQIVSRGKRIYCSDQREVERFEDYVYSAYTRLNAERKGILEDIRRRGNVYGR